MSTSSLDKGGEHDFDWEHARQRISAANVALAESAETTPELLQQAWARRAAQLAQIPAQEDKEEQIELVLIQLGRETYGLDVQYVSNIRPAEKITRVPRVPDWVTGVVNLRGRVLSVVDLRRFFGLPCAEEDRDSGLDGSTDSSQERAEGMPCLVVVETPGMEIALLADHVLTVEALPASQVHDTAGTIRGLRPEYVRGVVTRQEEETGTGRDGSMWVVLDLPAMLADERLIVHEEIV